MNDIDKTYVILKKEDFFFSKIKERNGKFYFWHDKGFSTDESISIAHLKNGKLHKEDGFALVILEKKYSPMLMWYVEGQHHRIDGYATMCGSVGLYYLNGKGLSKEDSERADSILDKAELKNFLTLLSMKYV
jgi:hypothetical protein